MFFCHSKHKAQPLNNIPSLPTQSSDWGGVQRGQDGEVGVEVVHLPQPLHYLYKLHHISLPLLDKILFQTTRGENHAHLGIRLLQDEGPGPVGHVVEVLGKLC